MKTANHIRLLRFSFIFGLALIADTAPRTQATKQTLADISKVDPNLLVHLRVYSKRDLFTVNSGRCQ